MSSRSPNPPARGALASGLQEDFMDYKQEVSLGWTGTMRRRIDRVCVHRASAAACRPNTLMLLYI